MSHLVTFALNHMVAPRRTVDRAGRAGQRGSGSTRSRSETILPASPISDGTPAAAGPARGRSRRRPDRLDQRAPALQRLDAGARRGGAGARALCKATAAPRRWSSARSTIPRYPAIGERAAGEAARGAARARADPRPKPASSGLVEPLGFAESSLRLKGEALEAIEELDLGERFRLVHDTFHHYLAGEPRMFPERTGLVHISGRRRSRPAARADARPRTGCLVGADDRLGNTRPDRGSAGGLQRRVTRSSRSPRACMRWTTSPARSSAACTGSIASSPGLPA